MQLASSQSRQQSDGPAIQWLESALAQLHTNGTPEHTEQRKAAECALLQFQRSDAAWALCLHLLSGTAPVSSAAATPNLLVFAAQTLRTKINESGFSLPDTHKEQLKQTLLQQLLVPNMPTPLLRQLCLALASLSALLPKWDDWLQPVGASLPWPNAVQLLHDVAEEGSSDWRHVIVPGLTSSEKLSWATTTCARFRSWSTDALQLLLSWHQQQQPGQQPQQVTVCVLECLTAWVKLGCLHHVSQELAEATAQVGLMHIQSMQEEVVCAALALLTELPEYAPEQLISSLEPHMLAVAAAAVQAAAATPPDVMHAAAWAASFAAYAAVVPQKLLAAEDDGNGGQQLRQALLQVAALHQLHNTQPICLAALHVWSNILGHESPSSAAAFTAAGGGAGSLSRASTAADAVETAAAVSQALTVADDACTPSEVPSGLVSVCNQLLLCTACNCMLWSQTPEGKEAWSSLEVSAAVQDLFLAVCCVIGQQRYMQCVLRVWGQQQQQQLGLQEPQVLLDPTVQRALHTIAAAPKALRLQLAVDLAAAAAVAHKPDVIQAVKQEGATQLAASITELLSHAASYMQQAGNAAVALQAQLSIPFCRAVKVWSSHLAFHFASEQHSTGAAGMGNLLQFLLALAIQQHDDTDAARTAAAAAAAGVRALTTAALHLGWDQLYMGYPLLLQAVQHLSGFDIADQDLFASLSMCLAAVGAPEQQLQDLRSSSAEQLVQPVVCHLGLLLQQLQAGQQWQDLGTSADVQLCQHLVRVRVVLEAAWQRQEQQRRQQLSCQPPCSPQQEPSMAARNTPAAASDMEEDASDSAGADAWQQHADEEQCQIISDLQQNPAVQLLLTHIMPQLHTLVVQHAAGGKFLQHYAKCCSKLLKLQPTLLLKPQQQLQQFLEVAVAGLARLGGCTLAEPLLLAVELCCQQPGSDLLLESAPCVTQVCAQLWSVPAVLALRQPGAGDAQPDLSEAVLKLSAAFIRHSSLLQPSSSQLSSVLPCIIAAAAACARCCHKKVGSCALTTFMALLMAAAAGSGSQQQLLQDLVASHGALIAYGALGALLVPSPLPRLQKVCSILLELAALASLVEMSGRHQDLPEGFSLDKQQQQLSGGCIRGTPAAPSPGVLQAWLCQATQGYVPTPLSSTEAADLAAVCAGLLASTAQASAANGGGGGDSSSSRPAVPASRSYIVARRLKKRLRDFAEKHMRTAAALPHQPAVQ